MEYKTYAQLKERVQQRLDLEEEVFIQEDEYLAYTQDAIDWVEAIIHKFNACDVYFEACAPLALVQGQSDYQLPSNIYGNKVRRIVYQKTNDIFEIKRMTRLNRYTDMAIRDFYNSDNWYMYMLLNQDPRTKPIIRLSPTAQSTTLTFSLSCGTTSGSATVTAASTTNVAIGQYVVGTGIPLGARVLSFVANTSITLTAEAYATGTVSLTFTDPDCLIYYIRNANKPTDDDSLIDIPEFYPLVQQHVMVECLKKEPGNPRLKEEKQQLAILRQQLEDTLSNMTPDQDDLIEADMSSYSDQSMGFGDNWGP